MVHRARLGGATVLLLDQEADSAVGRQPRPRGAAPKHVQLQLQLRGRRADQCQDTSNTATMWTKSTNVENSGTVVVLGLYVIAGIVVTNFATETNENVKIELVIMIGSVGRLSIQSFIVITCVTLKFLKGKGKLISFKA